MQKRVLRSLEDVSLPPALENEGERRKNERKTEKKAYKREIRDACWKIKQNTLGEN